MTAVLITFQTFPERFHKWMTVSVYDTIDFINIHGHKYLILVSKFKGLNFVKNN